MVSSHDDEGCFDSSATIVCWPQKRKKTSSKSVKSSQNMNISPFLFVFWLLCVSSGHRTVAVLCDPSSSRRDCMHDLHARPQVTACVGSSNLEMGYVQLHPARLPQPYALYKTTLGPLNIASSLLAHLRSGFSVFLVLFMWQYTSQNAATRRQTLANATV